MWTRNPPPPDDADADKPPSKTKLKQEMHTRQNLGEQLAELSPARLRQLDLPDVLVAAIEDYRRFNKWEALRRQMQYIGRLMRDIDPAPIAAQLDSWSQGTRANVAGFHAVEKWRDRLLADTTDATAATALAELVAEHPDANRKRIAELIARAHAERENGKPPASSRLLFKELSKTLGPKNDAAE